MPFESDQQSQPCPLTDEVLLLRYRDQGDEDAFCQLVHRYEHELFHYLWRYLHNASVAEEVFQATFLKLAQHSDHFLADHRVRPWLYTIATHLAIDALRHAGRHRAVSLDAEHSDDATLGNLLIDHGETPGARAELDELIELLRIAISRLPARLREPLKLVYFDGLEYADAAQRLNIPLGTLKSRLHESLMKLTTLR